MNVNDIHSDRGKFLSDQKRTMADKRFRLCTEQNDTV